MKKSVCVSLLLFAVVILSHAQILHEEGTRTWVASTVSPVPNGQFANGSTATINDNVGSQTQTWEVNISGTAPGTMSIPFLGCMRSGTCDAALSTFTSVSSGLVHTSGLYDNFHITATWTGGDSTTLVVVNRRASAARGGGGITGGINAEPPVFSGGTTIKPDPSQLQSDVFDTTDTDRALAILSTWRAWATTPNSNGLFNCVDARGEIKNATGANSTILTNSNMFGIPSFLGGTDGNFGTCYRLPGAVFSVQTSQQINLQRTSVYGMVPSNNIAGTFYGSGFVANASWNANTGVGSAAVPCTNITAGWCPGLNAVGLSPGQMAFAGSTAPLSPSTVEEEEMTWDCNSTVSCIPLTIGTCGDRVWFNKNTALKNFLGPAIAVGFGTGKCNSSGGFPQGYFITNSSPIQQAAIGESAWSVVAGNAGFYYVITYSGSPTTLPQAGDTFILGTALPAGTTYTPTAGIYTIAGVSYQNSSNVGNFIDLNGAGITGIFTTSNQFAVRAPSTVTQTDAGSATPTASAMQWLTPGMLWNLNTGNLVDSNYSNSSAGSTATATGTVGVAGTVATFTKGSGNLPAQFVLWGYMNIVGCGGAGNTSGAGTNITAQITAITATTFNYVVAGGTNNGTGTCTAGVIPAGIGHDENGSLFYTQNGHDEYYAVGRSYGVDNVTFSARVDGEECAFTWACLYISGNFSVTSITATKIQAPCGIGNYYSVYDVPNGNFLTCKNNPQVEEYTIDGNGYAWVTAKTCSEMSSGFCRTNSTSNYYSAGGALLSFTGSTGAIVAKSVDLSGSATANALKVPGQAGLVSDGANSIGYDTTAKNFHVPTNSTDGLVLVTGAVPVNNRLMKANGGGTINSSGASSVTDNGTTVSSAETLTIGTAAGAPGIVDLTTGYTTSAMGAQSSASCTNITGMTWNVAANKRYTLHCAIPMTFAASATVAFCIGGPGSPTSHTINAIGSIGAAGVYDDIFLINSATYGTKTTASGVVGASSQVILVDAEIQNGATASGTALTLQTAANGTNTITVLADAACRLVQAN